MLGPCVNPVVWYQDGLAEVVGHGPAAALGASPPPLALLTSHSVSPGVPASSAQIACSWTVVPGVPPRETKSALPVAPAAAISASAPATSCGELASTAAGSPGGPSST